MKYKELEIEKGGGTVIISAAEYVKLKKAERELKDVVTFEKQLARIFDSDSRVAKTILERIRKIEL